MKKSLVNEIIQWINWHDVNYSGYYPLSIDFVKQFPDKIEWGNIHHYNTLSDDFIREFKDKLDLSEMLLNDHISQKFYDELTQ